MKSILGITLTACLFVSQALFAGVVYEIETKGSSGAPETSTVSVEGNNLIMDMNQSGSDQPGKIIFRGESEELLMVDDRKKSYMVIDEATIKKLSEALGGVSSQLQEALKNVPESQRAMMEKMLKDKMPQYKMPEMPKIEVKKTGKKANHGGYPCVRYDVIQDGKKIQEMWVTPWNKVKGGKEVASCFTKMGAFYEKLLSAFQFPGGQGMAEQIKKNMFAQMGDLKGFPVMTRDFSDSGSVEKETLLKSANVRKLDPADFKPPAGYKRQQISGF